MRKQVRILLLTCIVVLLSSCDSTQWSDGTLDYSFDTTTSRLGYFECGDVFTTSDVGINVDADYVDQVRLTRSVIEITGKLYRGDIIRGLKVDVDNVGVLSFPDIAVERDGYVLISDTRYDNGYYNFMYDAITYLSRFNKHDIIISGYLYNTQLGYVATNPITIRVTNDVDVHSGLY